MNTKASKRRFASQILVAGAAVIVTGSLLVQDLTQASLLVGAGMGIAWMLIIAALTLSMMAHSARRDTLRND